MTAPTSPPDNAVPRAGMLATVRNRRGVVAAVEPFDGERGWLHLVHLEYMDDHAPSEERLLWELEPSHHLLEPNALPDPTLAGAMPADDSPHLPWDLLIVDECHNLMPSPFGEDSELCRMLGVVAPRFEHRLFLSATPHNGHTRSFTGLLEVLDPVRFTRTNEMNDAMRGRVEDVVIRRLKRDINAANLRPEPGRAVGGPSRESSPEPRRARGSLSPGSSL